MKFENIMFENRSPDAEIKLIDFGLSKKFLPGDQYMTEGVGTVGLCLGRDTRCSITDCI